MAIGLVGKTEIPKSPAIASFNRSSHFQGHMSSLWWSRTNSSVLVAPNKPEVRDGQKFGDKRTQVG